MVVLRCVFPNLVGQVGGSVVSQALSFELEHNNVEPLTVHNAANALYLLWTFRIRDVIIHAKALQQRLVQFEVLAV